MAERDAIRLLTDSVQDGSQPAPAASGLPAARVVRPAEVTPELAAGLAALSRQAYAGSDPLPGLPAPDGQFETPQEVLATLDPAGRVYLVQDGPGRLLAALRVSPAPGCWRVGRISVLPAARGRGLVGWLLDAVAGDARQQGVAWLELDAVVERCLPPLYARLGFDVRSSWPSPDKPLSEVTMRRPTAGPAGPVPLGWSNALLGEHRAVVAWFLRGSALLRISRPASGDPLADAVGAAARIEHADALLAGLDLSRQDPDHLDRIEVSHAGRTHPEHLMPRRRNADTLALWRPAPGREVAIGDLWAGGTP
jgi:GNAT superfamily N-acetyltransferase